MDVTDTAMDRTREALDIERSLAHWGAFHRDDPFPLLE